MALTAKPYDPLQLIIDAQFRGKPNIFADVDINQFSAIFLQSISQLWSLSGALIQDGAFTAVSLAYNGTGQLVYDITWEPFFVAIRGMQFNMPAGGITGTTATAGRPGVRLYLVATNSLVTFADNPVISGISGTELPVPLAGADHDQYSNPRIAYVEYPNNVVLGPGEEVVCPLYSIIPMNVAGVVTPTPYLLTAATVYDKIIAAVGNNFSSTNWPELIAIMFDYFKNISTEAVGSVKMYNGPLLGNFDATGLGIGPWANWASLNGQNGQDDWQDRFPLMYDFRSVDPNNGIWDPAYNVMGNKGGNRQIIQTVDQMPFHEHTLDSPDGLGYVNDTTGGGSRESLKGDNDNSVANGPITTFGAGGSGAGLTPEVPNPITIIPPYVVTLFIRKYQ